MFPDAACVTALVDRLTHYAGIISIVRESYRRREAEAAQEAR
ncbi:ATP-binding protein [Candidatus Methylomirabilis sp.]|nr:ATP-binding protein [Candidatus Methylomirabilis sp.]